MTKFSSHVSVLVACKGTHFFFQLVRNLLSIDSAYLTRDPLVIISTVPIIQQCKFPVVFTGSVMTRFFFSFQKQYLLSWHLPSTVTALIFFCCFYETVLVLTCKPFQVRFF